VWAIVENNTVNIYLIEGTDSTLVIDAGYGIGDLKGYIETLTDRPLIMVNTHGHGDHNGADYLFSKVYAHEKDREMIQFALQRTKDKQSRETKIITIGEGYIFNLGDRKLEVIEVPGHTSGSICLLDRAHKILFAGDNTNAIVWLFLKGCHPLEVYLQSLEKVEKQIADYDIIMPGHNAPLANTFIYEQIACVKSILDGTCTSVPYNYSEMTKGALLCKYKTSEVAYNPNNLFITDNK
jgi:glyoxylase-like metal-dependent hydrolase (beta-lactamase superfamily II)